MSNKMVSSAVQVALGYIITRCAADDIIDIKREMTTLIGEYESQTVEPLRCYSYSEAQSVLETLNEKETIRKSKGVYYTPTDVVRYILANSIKLASGKLTANNINQSTLKSISTETVCFDKTVYEIILPSLIQEAGKIKKCALAV